MHDDAHVLSPLLSRRRLLRLAATALGAGALTCRGLAQPRAAARGRAQIAAPNMIIVVVDSLRADHASCYGYSRPTTPMLDAQVAVRGVRFVQATTAVPWTLPANAALLTGRLPAEIGVTWRGTPIPDDVPCLAGQLRAAGYYTAGFANTYYIAPEFGFDRGFDRYDYQPPAKSEVKVAASTVTSRALSWLQGEWSREHSDQPLLLFVYYFDPHPPYLPPKPYDTRYTDPGYSGTLTGERYSTGLPVLKGEIAPTAADIQHLKDLYDGEVSYWDEQLGLLIDGLEGLGLLSNGVLLVTSDHGEQFGEHGKWSHTSSLYEEVMRVPLLLRYDGVLPAGRVVTAHTQHLDVVPTLLDLAGVEVPPGLSGLSLRGLATGSPIELPRDIFGEVNGAIADARHPLYWYSAHADLRSLTRDGYKLIHHLGRDDLDELYLLGASSLYEGKNLAGTTPELAERARRMREDLLAAYYPQQGYMALMLR